MDIETLYKQLLTDTSARIKSFGYKRNNSNFYLQDDGNWGIINFQKSTKSNSETIFFTINLGVASSVLLKFFATRQSKSGPSLEACHWRIRLGHLLQGNDVWWSIESDTPIEILSEELWMYLRNSGIPKIAKYIRDSDLRDLWLSDSSPSLTEFQRLLNLSVLLKEIGPKDLLEPTLRRLKQISAGKPTAITADIYIQKLLNG